MRAALVLWWQRLAERERRLVVLGTAIVLAVLVYMTLWEPAANGIRRLRADLPPLREQEASLRSMATEASTLRAAGGAAAAVAPADRVAAVRRSLQRAGLWRDASTADPARPSAQGASAAAPSTISTLTVAGAVTTVASSPTARFEPPEIVAEANDRVRVRFADIDYGVWVAWLASTETELATRAARVSVAALAPRGPVGHVKAEALLDWSQAASPGNSSTTRP